MRKNSGGSRLVAGAIAIMLMAPVGTLASQAFAQSSAPAATSAAPSPQVPQPDEGGVNWQGVGYGTGSLFTNVLYIPAKLVYAIFGGLIGGGAWCVTGGNTQAANTIWRSSLGGDYVVTPDMLAGKEPIHFSGPTGTPPDTTVQPVAVTPMPAPAPAYSSASGYTTPSSTLGSQPMDHGAGSVARPGVPSTLPDTSIE